MNRPSFSIIIVHRNGSAMLRETVKAALAAMGPEDELIVVDNGSTDDSRTMLVREFPQVQCLANGCNAGYARACNRGIAIASGHYLLLLNNDALLPSDALERFSTAFQNNAKLALIGAQLVAPNGTLQRSYASAPNWLSELGFRRRKPAPVFLNVHGLLLVETLVGACIAVRRAAIEVSGPMDEDFFFYYEEIEWCVRLRHDGWQIAIDPEVRVIHRKGGSTQPVKIGAQIEALRSRLIYYRKTFPRALSYLLIVNRAIRLTVNTLAFFTLSVVTLGIHPRIRHRAITYSVQFLWMLLGCPKRWGLPGKCDH